MPRNILAVGHYALEFGTRVSPYPTHKLNTTLKVHSHLGVRDSKVESNNTMLAKIMNF
jgi:hypothetical protein